MGPPDIFNGERNKALKYTCVIWDFNGTILDDVQIGMDSLNVLLERRGLPVIGSNEKYRSGFMFPIIDGYRKLGFDFEKESYDTVAEEWVREYVSREHTAGLVEGVETVLQYFQEQEIKQIIISASESCMLKRQLENLGVSEYFEEIVGLDNIHAAGKKDIAVSWREKHPNDKLLFIGDTDHDHQVATAINADCILVSAGHQSFERLEKLVPKLAVLKTPAEIIDTIQKIK